MAGSPPAASTPASSVLSESFRVSFFRVAKSVAESFRVRAHVDELGRHAHALRLSIYGPEKLYKCLCLGFRV